MASNDNPQTRPQSNISYMIQPARAPADIAATADLFTQYTTWLNIDLTFQDYASELASLPGKYHPSQGGEILLARNEAGEAVGCIALRALPSDTPQSHKTAELKRLYIRPSTRGSGLGTRLAEQMIAVARHLGYREIKLDTLSRMQAAGRMYERLGFRDIEPYYRNPTEGVRYLGLLLA